MNVDISTGDVTYKVSLRQTVEELMTKENGLNCNNKKMTLV